MQFTVISGEYTTKITSYTAIEAATSAMESWKMKKNKPTLSKITTVTDVKKKKINFLTNSFFE